MRFHLSIRQAMTFGFIALLASCTIPSAHHYTTTVESWRGGNSSTLLKSWGKPDKKMTTLNGNTVLVYKTITYQSDTSPSSPGIGVSYTPGGSPVLTTAPSPRTSWPYKGASYFCIVAFEVNKQNTIVNTQIQGNHCFGGARFVHSMRNPDGQ